MKKITALFVLLAAVTAGTFAAGARDSAIVEGKLVMAGNVPTVVSGKDTYLLPAGPFYELAWQNGIKVGDTIKVDGLVGEALTAAEAEDASLPVGAKPVAPTKVWVNGKELSLDNLGFGSRGAYGRGNGFADADAYGRGRGRGMMDDNRQGMGGMGMGRNGR